jgi:hypothetical protein
MVTVTGVLLSTWRSDFVNHCQNLSPGLKSLQVQAIDLSRLTDHYQARQQERLHIHGNQGITLPVHLAE